MLRPPSKDPEVVLKSKQQIFSTLTFSQKQGAKQNEL
jgi:hypothetical protein